MDYCPHLHHLLQIIATGQKASGVRLWNDQSKLITIIQGKTALYCAGDKLEHTIQI